MSEMPQRTKAGRATRMVFRIVNAPILISVAVLSAQSGRSYGPGHIWWDAGAGGMLPWNEEYDNAAGQVGIYNASGAVEAKGHPFFEPLGTNGRACVTCHQPSNGMSVSAEAIRGRWEGTHGKDPIFAAVDGSNCPDLPQNAKASHSLLLNRGVFRIALPWPPKPKAENGTPIEPEFQIEVVRDPTGCNTSREHGIASRRAAVSVYRRPRVAANLSHLTSGPTGISLMGDGREPSLSSQAATAALVHEQAESAPRPEALRAIVEFEKQVHAAQISDIRGGLLNEKRGLALGPENLARGRAGMLARISFDPWRMAAVQDDVQLDFRASAARGSDLFFLRSFRIGESTVSCATCHREGSTRWMDIGTANVSRDRAAPDLPLFRITCRADVAPHPVLGRVFYTQDPGRGLISGKCADVGSIVMQQFHALPARSPYFSNGSARTLREVIDFYESRYKIRYTNQEKEDLANFLSVL